MKRRNHKRVLVLELGHHMVQAVEIRRGKGGPCEIRHSPPSALTLDTWAADPQLVGREILNLLTAAGFKPGECMICLPAGQFLLHTTPLPDLPPEDSAAFLKLEAERAFPFAPEDLAIATSIATQADGTRQAMLVALLASHAQRLGFIARHAGLRLVSITLGSLALLPAAGTEAQATLSITPTGTELAVAADGGLLALRALGDANSGPREAPPDVTALTRECRITLARLPDAVRQRLTAVDVHAYPELPAALRTALALELESLGLELRPVGITPTGERVAGAANTHSPGATLAGLRWLRGEAAALEFLAPRVNRLRQSARQYMARGMLWRVGGAAAALAFIVALAIGWQTFRLARLEARWAAIESRVKTAQTLQQRIREYRPWYDETIQSLSIIRALTAAFPERGDVWARSVEIQEMEHVVCTGYAKNESAALRVQDRLLQTKGIGDLRISQLRGTDPLQFSLSYRWLSGGHDGQAQP